MDCLFCKIIKKEEKAKILYEDDLIMIIMDAYPNVDGHSLIIPKKHYENYEELPDEVLIHINRIAKEKAPLFLKTLNKNALTLSVNFGESQIIKHYHLHILPNYWLETEPKHTTEEMYELLKDKI